MINIIEHNGTTGCHNSQVVARWNPIVVPDINLGTISYPPNAPFLKHPDPPKYFAMYKHYHSSLLHLEVDHMDSICFDCDTLRQQQNSNFINEI
jgi:hypothetical protein